MPERCGHKGRVANQERCGIAPGNKSTDIPGTFEVGVEPGHDVIHRQDERSPCVSESYEVIIPAEDFEAQFLLNFSNLPTN